MCRSVTEGTGIKAVEMVRKIRNEQDFLEIIERARQEFREGKTISLEEMKQAFSD